MCNVVPMDATHLILGRPWQCDRRVSFDGFRNEYTVQHQGKVYKLLPMSPEEVRQLKMVHVKKVKGMRGLFAWTKQKTTTKLLPEGQRLKAQDSRTNLLQPGGNDKNQLRKSKEVKTQSRKGEKKKSWPFSRQGHRL